MRTWSRPSSSARGQGPRESVHCPLRGVRASAVRARNPPTAMGGVSSQAADARTPGCNGGSLCCANVPRMPPSTPFNARSLPRCNVSLLATAASGKKGGKGAAPQYDNDNDNDNDGEEEGEEDAGGLVDNMSAFELGNDSEEEEDDAQWTQPARRAPATAHASPPAAAARKKPVAGQQQQQQQRGKAGGAQKPQPGGKPAKAGPAGEQDGSAVSTSSVSAETSDGGEGAGQAGLKVRPSPARPTPMKPQSGGPSREAQAPADWNAGAKPAHAHTCAHTLLTRACALPWTHRQHPSPHRPHTHTSPLWRCLLTRPCCGAWTHFGLASRAMWC
jgi:hypothetical protein